MNKPKALLLDTINPEAGRRFEEAGYMVEKFPKTINTKKLMEYLEGVEVLGIRSEPAIPAEIIDTADELRVIGAYCVGTEKIDKTAALDRKIEIFNAPYDNGRSVAELVIGATISLVRRVHEHNLMMHNGQWTKTAESSYEVRGKTLGIIGYGNIGQQVGTLAEAMGMKVLFNDTHERAPLGNAQPAQVQTLLEKSDVITLHVPGGQDGPVLGPQELGVIKPGASLINTARPEALDYTALRRALIDGRLGGIALDVFPDEPRTKTEEFVSNFRADPRVLLTPHIGGSTQEAEFKAAESVTDKILNHLKTRTKAAELQVAA